MNQKSIDIDEKKVGELMSYLNSWKKIVLFSNPSLDPLVLAQAAEQFATEIRKEEAVKSKKIGF